MPVPHGMIADPNGHFRVPIEALLPEGPREPKAQEFNTDMGMYFASEVDPLATYKDSEGNELEVVARVASAETGDPVLDVVRPAAQNAEGSGWGVVYGEKGENGKLLDPYGNKPTTVAGIRVSYQPMRDRLDVGHTNLASPQEGLTLTLGIKRPKQQQ